MLFFKVPAPAPSTSLTRTFFPICHPTLGHLSYLKKSPQPLTVTLFTPPLALIMSPGTTSSPSSKITLAVPNLLILTPPVSYWASGLKNSNLRRQSPSLNPKRPIIPPLSLIDPSLSSHVLENSQPKPLPNESSMNPSLSISFTCANTVALHSNLLLMLESRLSITSNMNGLMVMLYPCSHLISCNFFPPLNMMF